jgi:hypothetical protein
MRNPINTNTDLIDEIEANMVQIPNPETIPPLETIRYTSLDSITILD